MMDCDDKESSFKDLSFFLILIILALVRLIFFLTIAHIFELVFLIKFMQVSFFFSGLFFLT